MKSLNAQEKKLYSKIAIILAGIIIVVFSYWGIISLFNNYKLRQNEVRQELIHKYESKIDSINTVNYMLVKNIDSLEKEVVSIQASKEYIYIEVAKTDSIIKDASAVEHAKALDTITKQDSAWAVVKDSTTKDTIIRYNFTKPGIVNLRLYINDLSKYKSLYNIDEIIIKKQRTEIDTYKVVVSNNNIALKAGEDALNLSNESNKKLTKQLNKVQSKIDKWPYWIVGSFVGGVVTCLILSQ